MRSGWLHLAALLCLASHARAQPAPRVVMVTSDASLASAVAGALDPWGVTLVVLEGEAPGATMPTSATRGRALANAQRADGVVWLSETEEGWAIWVYDAESDRAMARPLPVGPPFDEATAAALALTVMAMLRHGATAPPRERLRPPASGSEAPSEEPPPEEPDVQVPEPAAREVRVEVAAGAEGWATTPDAVEARLALTLGYWPAAWDSVGGLEVSARLGAGLGLSRRGVTGRLFDTRLLLRGRLRTAPTPGLVLGVGLGLGVRILVLDGSHPSRRLQGQTRVAGILELSSEIGLDLSPVVLLLRAGASLTPWLQAYEVDGVPVLTSNVVWPLVELALEVGF